MMAAFGWLNIGRNLHMATNLKLTVYLRGLHQLLLLGDLLHGGTADWINWCHDTNIYLHSSNRITICLFKAFYLSRCKTYSFFWYLWTKQHSGQLSQACTLPHSVYFLHIIGPFWPSSTSDWHTFFSSVCHLMFTLRAVLFQIQLDRWCLLWIYSIITWNMPIKQH